MTPTNTPATTPPSSERWAWIELLGFDLRDEDLGVGAVLGRMGFVPDGISLLLFNADFIHTHGQRDAQAPFPADYCSYFGHPGNEERGVQPWTAPLLRRLVETLQSHGARVYVSVFDLFASEEWIGQHPELLACRRNGERVRSLCPWKHLADGSLYENFFTRQLVRVLKDYGFDGFHCADGFAHQRIPLSDGDFSDDLVGQFVAATGCVLPDDCAGPCAADSARLERRAEWIWAQRRAEWIRFYANRITRFMQTLAAAVHAERRHLVSNSAWTKDPFEALYRYGVDYRANAEAGIDAYIVEAAAGASELDGYERVSGRRALYPYAAAVLLNHAYLPETPLLFLNGIKDTTEEWCLLRHTPPLLEAEIHTMCNLFGYAPDGTPKRCLAGPVACLADGLTAEEWSWLRRAWDAAVEFTPTRILGATLVWSDAALRAQLSDYIASRRWSTHRLLHHLLERGAPVHAVVRVAELDRASGPLLVLNAHLFPENEMKQVLNHGQQPVVLIGAGPVPALPAATAFADPALADGLWCVVRGLPCSAELATPSQPLPDLPTDLASVRDPAAGHAMFYHDLPYRAVSPAFLDACAEVLAQAAAGVRALSELDTARVTAIEDARGVRRLLIGNDAHWYINPQIEVGRPLRAVHIRTPFPAVPGGVGASSFHIRVPGRGMVVVDVD